MPRIAFVTCRKWPQLYEDDYKVVEYLRQQGLTAEAAVWDDENVDWAGYDSLVLRSTWDYYHQPVRFLDWLEKVSRLGGQVWNPPEVVRWNADKCYLRDLAAKGIETVPTIWLSQGSQANLSKMLADQGWDEAVVKPAISAEAYQTWRTNRATAPSQQSLFEEMTAQAGVLVQPFMPQIQAQGEWSLIFFNKQYSHSVLKRVQQGDFRVQAHAGGTAERVEPSAALIEQARLIVEMVEQPLLYARVDGLEVAGRLQLMELELIEPYLFLVIAPGAVERFGQAIMSTLK